MQKFEFLRQPLLGELAMSWRERKKRERERERETMPFIVATYVSASSQGQRTHSARTNLEVTAPPAQRRSDQNSRENKSPFQCPSLYFDQAQN